MKKSILFIAVCATLIVNLPVDAMPQTTAAPAVALEPVPAAKAAPASEQQTGTPATVPNQAEIHNLIKRMPIWRVYEPVTKEMLMPYVLKPVTKAGLNRLVDFQFSDATQANFKEMFGNATPLHINLQDNAAGGVDMMFLLQALDYKDAQSDNQSRWEPLIGRVSYSKDLKHFNTVADWPYFSQRFGDNAGFELKQVHIVQDATYNQHHLAIGKGQFVISELSFFVGHPDKGVKAHHVELTSDISQVGTKLTMAVTTSIGEMQVADQTVGPIHFDYSLLNLNEAAAADFMKSAVELSKNQPSMEKQLAESHKLFSTKLLPVISPTSRFEIKDLSVVYQSLKAALKGAVWLDNAKKSDMTSVSLLQKKIAAHVELTMPKALALKITKLVSAIKPGPNAEQQTNAGLQALIAADMIKEEQDQLSVVFDYTNGVKKVNGHDINDKPKK